MVIQCSDRDTLKNTPNSWDLLDGNRTVLDRIEQMAAHRVEFYPYEIATLAASGVIDAYVQAKGDTDVLGVVQTCLSIPFATHVTAMALPLAGVAAAFGVDYAIFGSAAQDLFVNTPEFGVGPLSFKAHDAFAFGSLIFASALGLSEKFNQSGGKVTLYVALLTASLGASFIAANNDDFRAHFSKTLASAFETGYDQQQAKVDGTKIRIENENSLIKSAELTLSTGGNPDKDGTKRGILADGNKNNDGLAEQLNQEIRDRKQKLTDLQQVLAEEIPILDQKKRKDKIDFTGRILAMGYIASWLIAAQLLIARIVSTAASSYKTMSREIAEKRRKSKFVASLENPNQNEREKAISSYTQLILSRVSEPLTNTLPKDEYRDKRNICLQNIFDKTETVEAMITRATQIVSGAITPRKA